MELSIEHVSPAIARRWLELNECNRRLREHTAAQYARDMAAGNWQLKPVAICFDSRGKLGNGQHTLTAIIQSNTTQTIMIARDCTKEQIASMDLGLRRSLTDIAHFVGGDISSRQAAIAKIIVYGIGSMGSHAYSFSETYEAYMAHKTVIDMVCENAPRQSGFSAPVLAVCARAAYSHDHEKVIRFIAVLNTGEIASPNETGAVRLRDFCRSIRSASGSRVLRTEIYNKAKAALDAFLHNRPMQKVYGLSAECFPIPDRVNEHPEEAA